MVSVLCVFPYDLLNWNFLKKLIHTLHNIMISLPCANWKSLKMLIHIICKNKFSLHCAPASVYLNLNFLKIIIHTPDINVVSFQYVFTKDFSVLTCVKTLLCSPYKSRAAYWYVFDCILCSVNYVEIWTDFARIKFLLRMLVCAYLNPNSVKTLLYILWKNTLSVLHLSFQTWKMLFFKI